MAHKIRMTTDYNFSTKIHCGDIRHCSEKGRIMEAKDISSNGWARVAMPLGGYAFIPHGTFEVVEEPKERTYTEAEMKAIRQAWEEKWITQQNRLDQAESYKEYWKDRADKVSDCMIAKQRKLDLLEPEIQKIEESIQRVVPEDEEGTIADHVETLASEVALWRRDYGKGRDYLTHHSIAGRVADIVDSFKPAFAELDKRLKDFKIPRSKEPIGVVSGGGDIGKLVFREDEPPEALYLRQQYGCAYKPRRVRGIR